SDAVRKGCIDAGPEPPAARCGFLRNSVRSHRVVPHPTHPNAAMNAIVRARWTGTKVAEISSVPRRTDEVREAFASVTRALKRVALYRHARDQHAAYLAPAFSALHGLLSTVPHLTLAVEPGALLFEGE